MTREGQTVTVTQGDANLSALVFLLHTMLKTYFKGIERKRGMTEQHKHCLTSQFSL